MSLKDALLGLLFPPVCLLCGEREEKDGLCASCRKKFARETYHFAAPGDDVYLLEE